MSERSKQFVIADDYELLFEEVSEKLDAYRANIELLLQAKLEKNDFDNENVINDVDACIQNLIEKYTQSATDNIYTYLMGKKKAGTGNENLDEIHHNMLTFLTYWRKWFVEDHSNESYMSELEYQGYTMGILDASSTLGSHFLISLAGIPLEQYSTGNTIYE